MEERIESLRGKLIVSCQALPHEPLHSSFIMGRMALAAREGGARGIRANTREDIEEICSQVDLPIIGIVKRDYPDSSVYITPTMREIEELMAVKPEIIAMDATSGLRPKNVTLDAFLRRRKRGIPISCGWQTVLPLRRRFMQTPLDLILSVQLWLDIHSRARESKLRKMILK